MSSVSRLVPLALAATALAAAPVRADHIAAHDECDLTFPMPIPGPEFFTGGILFVTLIGPVEDTVITSTTFTVTFVSDGVTPASDIDIEVSVPVDLGNASIIVTGADLGFGAGPGTFTGTFTTDALNGVVWQQLFPHSIVDLEIHVPAGNGWFENSTITFDVIPAPPCCPGDIDGSGTVGFADLSALLADWGHVPGSPADFDGDNTVGFSDLNVLLAAWGPC